MDPSPILAVPAPSRGEQVRLGLFGDERLARLVAGGSERAFATLYARYHQQLYRYCRSIVRDETDAEDVLQSALASAFAALKRGQRDAPLRPWLFRIAHNEAISFLRRHRAGTQLVQDATERWAPSAEECAGERARVALLLTDLQQLPERQRGALLMRELSGLSHEEIAVALGTSVGVAKQAIFEARHGLLEFAEGRSMRCEDVRRMVSDGDRRVLRGRRVRAHLSDCAGCSAFAAAIPARRDDFQALVPGLVPAASAALLASITGGGSGHGAAGGLGAAVAGAAGKTAAATIGAKAIVGVGAVVIALAGVGGVRALLVRHGHVWRPLPSANRDATTAGGRALGEVTPPALALGFTRGPSGVLGRPAAKPGTAGGARISTKSVRTTGGHGRVGSSHARSTGAHGKPATTSGHGNPGQSPTRGRSGAAKAPTKAPARRSSSAGSGAAHRRTATGSHRRRASGSHAARGGSASSTAHVHTAHSRTAAGLAAATQIFSTTATTGHQH
jgi:RNA polymerase sigma factor (sigma-70 family)